MDADHFLAAAQRNLVYPIVDVAECQAEALGKGLDLVSDPEEFGVFVLRCAFDVEGGDGHQFTQGFAGGLAVLDAGVQAEQAVDFVLLLGGQWLAGQVGIERCLEVVGLGQVAAFELAEELLEVAWVAAVEGFDDGRGLLLGKVGLCRLGEQADAGQQQGGGGKFFQVHGCAHSFANHCCGLPVGNGKTPTLTPMTHGTGVPETRHVAQTKKPRAQAQGFLIWRTRRDSNPRPLPSEGSTLSS